MPRLRRLPIFSQMLLLLFAMLAISYVVNLLSIIAEPLPRMDFYAMRDIAQAVRRPDRVGTGPATDNLLKFSVSNAPPELTPERIRQGLVTSAALSRQFADELGMPLSKVRLIYHQDQTNWPFRTGQTKEGVPLRLGEPQFYNRVIGAIELPDGNWQSVQTPDRPFPSRYQQRAIRVYLVDFLIMLPLAWIFARHIALPIRHFAAAADRVGRDNEAPPVEVDGSTELKLAAHALTTMQERLTEMLAERTAMIGAIAHDLRTPLARIAFRIEGATNQVRDAVLADIEQMRAMIAATMSFVGRQTELGNYGSVDLRQLLERIAADAQLMQRDVVLAHADDASLTGDGIALERMVQNVVDNALHYAGAAEIELTSTGDRTVISVADRGPGLSGPMLESVFKPFNRGDPSRNRSTGGLGLGLAIARSIAIAHEGTLRAENREGGGLVVIADFPAG